MAEQFPRVGGYCPMGCGETLFLGEDGYVTCSLIECPRPDAAAVILDNPAEHRWIKNGTRPSGALGGASPKKRTTLGRDSEGGSTGRCPAHEGEQ